MGWTVARLVTVDGLDSGAVFLAVDGLDGVAALLTYDVQNRGGKKSRICWLSKELGRSPKLWSRISEPE